MLRRLPLALVLIAGCNRPAPGSQPAPGAPASPAPHAATAASDIPSGVSSLSPDRPAGGATSGAANGAANGTSATTSGATSGAASGGQAAAEDDRDLPSGEAPRTLVAHEEAVRLRGDSPYYRAHLAVVDELVKKRFPGVLAQDLDLQVVPMNEGSLALLVSGPGGSPLMFAFDRQRNLLWTRDRVLGGLDPSVRHYALCAGPEGDVMLAFYDPPTGMVAARHWDKIGYLLADFRLTTADHLDGIAALFWPEHGWVVVFTGNGQLRAQLLGEQGGHPWGSEGRVLASAGVSAPRPRLVLDTAVSVVSLWQGTTAGQPRTLAQRIDTDGRTLWKLPAEVGEAGFVEAERTQNAEVGVQLRKAGATKPYGVSLDAEGVVRLR